MSMARSAAQGATVQTVPKVPIPASTGLCAYCVQKVNLAVLLEHLISRRVKTALPVDIHPLLEFLRNRTATCALPEKPTAMWEENPEIIARYVQLDDTRISQAYQRANL